MQHGKGVDLLAAAGRIEIDRIRAGAAAQHPN
jgi:hypothetical protein